LRSYFIKVEWLRIEFGRKCDYLFLIDL